MALRQIIGEVFQAAEQGDASRLQEILDSYPNLANAENSYIPSNTALHAAIAGERNMEVIELLLTHNAQTNIFDSNDHTFLHSAAYHDDNVEMVALLIKHGADMNARGKDGDSAFDLAIKQGNHNNAELLR